jgi:hypothetical protein
MGANYDVLIASGAVQSDVLTSAAKFLAKRSLNLTGIVPLHDANINDDCAILVSMPENRWIGIVASAPGIRVPLAEWFNENPLGVYLSEAVRTVVHLWSLDSGYVAGYTVYSSGKRIGGECVFANEATSKDELMPGVPAPKDRNGGALSRLLGAQYDFVREMRKCPNLEIGLASLVAQFGFAAQLLDYYEAIDDHRGIAVVGNKYVTVDLCTWAALVFTR